MGVYLLAPLDPVTQESQEVCLDHYKQREPREMQLHPHVESQQAERVQLQFGRTTRHRAETWRLLRNDTRW